MVSKQDRKLRKGKVLVDWSQNDYSKTTVAVYSLRCRERPWASVPLTWDEVAELADDGDPWSVRFEAPQVLERVAEHGDLFAPGARAEAEAAEGLGSRDVVEQRRNGRARRGRRATSTRSRSGIWAVGDDLIVQRVGREGRRAGARRRLRDGQRRDPRGRGRRRGDRARHHAASCSRTRGATPPTAGVEVEWVEGDAQDLPFDDGSFDVVVSTFGCMFAPDHKRAAARSRGC